MILAHNILDCDVVEHNVVAMHRGLGRAMRNPSSGLRAGKLIVRARVDDSGRILEIGNGEISLLDPNVVSIEAGMRRLKGASIVWVPTRVRIRSSSGLSESAKASLHEGVERVRAALSR